MQPINKVAVVGTGLVGASWLVVFARAGKSVAAFDANAAQRDAALQQVDRSLAALAAAGLLADATESVRARIKMHATLEAAVSDADYVQETIVENLDAKRSLFSRLDEICQPHTLLASSTSTFQTSSFAATVRGGGRCLVVHPLNPPHLIPFTEVSGAPFTTDANVTRALEFMKEVGQSPIRIQREIEGFVLNRLQWSLLAEACRLVADGIATCEDVDAALKDGLARRWVFMGPFEVGDLNAPGGLRDYMQRFGPAISAIAQSRGATPLPLTSEFIEKVHVECREKMATSSRSQRVADRDARLMALHAHLLTFTPATISSVSGPPPCTPDLTPA